MANFDSIEEVTKRLSFTALAGIEMDRSGGFYHLYVLDPCCWRKHTYVVQSIDELIEYISTAKSITSDQQNALGYLVRYQRAVLRAPK